MYQIIKDGAVLAMVEAPTYIRLLDNGCYGLCGAEEAEGVAHSGTPYRLAHRPELKDLEPVVLAEVDGGGMLKSAQDAADELVVAALETDAAMGGVQAAIDCLVIANLEGGVERV